MSHFRFRCFWSLDQNNREIYVNWRSRASSGLDDIVSVTAGLRFLDERLTIGARYSYYSQSTQITYGSDFTGAISSTPSPSYNLVDLFGSYKLSDNLTFRVDATNLLDEAYTPALSVAPTGFSGDTGQGRTVLMSLGAHF